MKTKKLFHVASVLAMGLALASCGSDNKSNGVSSNGFGNFNVGSNGQTVSSNTCQGGQATSYSFSLTGYSTNYFHFSGNSITQSGGYVNNGGTNVFYGRDVGTGDQIAIQKVSNGQQAQYNIQMSICPMYANGQLMPIQIQNIQGGWVQLGAHTASGVNSTISFCANVGGYQACNLGSVFSPAQ